MLGVARVGLDDDFFAMGGHSLTAVRLAGRIRTTWGKEVPIRTLFRTPTVAGLVTGCVRPAGRGRRCARAPRPAVIPLSYAQQRLWFLDRLEPGRATYHIPVALRLTGPLG